MLIIQHVVIDMQKDNDMASYFLQPFQSTSIWNAPIPVTATYKAEPKVAPLVVGLSSWLPNDSSSVPIYQASATDQIISVLYNPNTWYSVYTGAWKGSGNTATAEKQILAGSSANFPFNYHTYVSQSGSGLVLPQEFDKIASLPSAVMKIKAPAGAKPTVNPDGHMVVYQPDGRVLETYGTVVLSNGTIVAQSYKITDPSLNGDGWQNGITASMIPVYAGVVREKELAAGLIDHAMKIVVPAGLLHPSYVYPALSFDRGAMTEFPAYSGDLPMGARLALPQNLDLNSLGLTTAFGKTIAAAAQKHGFIITDRGGSGITIITEKSASTPELDKYDYARDADLQKIFDATKRVMLDGADTLGGGPNRDVIYSGGGNDTINGLGGNDDLFGESGNDVLNGGAGNDRLWGGPGTNRLDGGADSDTVVYAGKSTDYTVTKTSTEYAVKAVNATSSTASNDTLLNIENVKFSDKTVALTPTSSSPTKSFDIVVKASADLYNGAPIMRVALDGKSLGDFTVTASHAAKQIQTFTFHQDDLDASVAHKLNLAFINDAWGGTSAADRNLWIDDVVSNGVDIAGVSQLQSNGALLYSL
jgi:Ca2+-binding RTX toxin-like protein